MITAPSVEDRKLKSVGVGDRGDHPELVVDAVVVRREAIRGVHRERILHANLHRAGGRAHPPAFSTAKVTV
jgi:hypothetical protein